MEYRYRISTASTVSLLIHLLGLAYVGYNLSNQTLSLSAATEPLVLNLQPPTPEPVRRLVDSLAPSDQPVEDSERIAERDTRAQDMVENEAAGSEPAVERLGEFEDLGSPPVPPPTPAVTPQPEQEEVAETEPEEDSTPEPVEEPGVDESRTKVAALDIDPLALPDPIAKPVPTQPKAAPPVPPVPPSPPVVAEELPSRSRGRSDGGVEVSGFLSFEAMEHEFAPYMKEIQKRVERQWRTALLTNYSGTSRTKAVLECAIRPDGAISFVRIVESGTTASFAPLCKGAVEKAGPFPPFPFKVPSVYRNKNLEIRWTFSYL